MSPEQLRGATGEIDGRSDVYALGVIFYRLMAGRLPAAGPPGPELSGSIAQVAMRAMSADRAHRYQSAADMAFDLRECLEGRVPASSQQTGLVAESFAPRVVTATRGDGRFVAVGLVNGTVVVLDPANGSPLVTISGDGTPLEGLAFDTDGRLAIVRTGGRAERIDMPAPA
jgi:hypothetical protein